MLFPQVAFHQVDAVVVGQGAGTPVVRGDALFVPAGKSLLAYDAKGLRPLWRRDLPYRVENATVVGDEVIVCGEPEWRGVDSRLYGLDARTGKIRWSVPRKGPGSPIVFDAGRIYASLTPGGLSALDRRTHRPLWTSPFVKSDPKKPVSGNVEALTLSGATLLGAFAQTLCAIDAQTGKPLWRRPKSYLFQKTIPTVGGIVWVSGDGESEGLDLRTGRPRWKNPKAGAETTAVVRGRFVGIGHGRFAALDPRTGKVAWSHPVGPTDTYSSGQFVATLGGAIIGSGTSRTVAVGPDGKLRWATPSQASIDRPIWSDGNVFVCFDGNRLLRYGPGGAAPLPRDAAARKVEAARLAARFDNLDGAGVARPTALGPDAFDPLFAAFRATCAAYDKDDSYPLYSRFHDMAKVLDGIMDASKTPALLQALDGNPKGSARPFVMGMVAKVGDPNLVVPRFLKSLSAPTPGFEMYESDTYVARSYILRSSHPDAVAFMIRALNDPKADPTLREAAYHHLAGTGGEAGRRAVLAARRSRELLPSVAARMNLNDVGRQAKDRKPTTILAEKGEYALAQSGVLGSCGDLWLLRKDGGSWKDPLFFGVSLDGVSRWAKNPGPVPKAFGKTAEELRKGAWEGLVGKLELSLDTDGDGLTDRMEARLQTDPNKADTDGDGDADGVDPWPNAAARALTEEERALNAVFEARYHFYEYASPAIYFGKKGTKPFEMVGWRGPVLWQAERDRDFGTPLERCYEQGVGFLGTDEIKWNADRTEARLTISTYYGGLNGTGYTAVVRKFGDEWLVVSLDQAYVS